MSASTPRAPSANASQGLPSNRGTSDPGAAAASVLSVLNGIVDAAFGFELRPEELRTLNHRGDTTDT
jgi:hypothetical protein